MKENPPHSQRSYTLQVKSIPSLDRVLVLAQPAVPENVFQRGCAGSELCIQFLWV